MANSYGLPEDPTSIDDPHYQGLVYTREHGANLDLQTARNPTGRPALHAAAARES